MRSLGINRPLSVLVFLFFCILRGSAQTTTAAANRTPANPNDTTVPRSKSRLTPEKASPTRIKRFSQAPIIDGRLDEPVWQQAAVLKDFIQIQPGDNIEPTKPTEVLLGYDSKTLYIGFRCPDDAGKVRATMAKRDQIWDDDNVGIFLDTFNDKRRAYALFFNALGVQADGIMTANGNEDYSIDIVMNSKGVITDDGYTVEIAIPFKSLRYEAGKDKLWGAHFFRRIKRFNNELDSWMPISRDISGWIIQEGHLTGIEGISTERTLELIPSLTISETGQRVSALPAGYAPTNLIEPIVDPGRIVNHPVAIDPGLTLKYLVTPAVTVDVALNPDFAQVEADQTVVTANQRFPIFFDEKRPFFFEGMDIFQTPIRALHTRAIVDPDYAGKLTGRRGKNTFAMLFASDDAPGNYNEAEINDPVTFPQIEPFIEKNAFIGVLRFKRDVGVENTVGFLATSYNFPQRHNQLAGFDGRFRLSKTTIFSFQVLGTNSTQDFYSPDLDKSVFRTGNGFAYNWTLDMSGRHFGYFVSGGGFTRDYRAAVGFTQRTNNNGNSAFYRYASDPKPKSKLISWRVNQFSRIEYDFQGRIQNWFTQPQLSFQLRRQTFIGTGYAMGYERVFEEEFGAKRTATRQGAFYGTDSERSARNQGIFTFIESEPTKKFSGFGFFRYNWGSLDYDFGAGSRYPRVSPPALLDPNAPLDPGPGRSLNLEANLTFKPSDAVRLQFSYNKSRLVRKDTGRTAFDENIFSLRGTYNFTRFVFVRARVDYATLASQARGQFLFGWAPNPGTSFYVGYNDDLTRNGYSPFNGQLEPGFRRNGRTVFIKMSYLIRKSH